MRVFPKLPPLAFLPSLVACETPDRPSGPTVRDSAGIEIVTNVVFQGDAVTACPVSAGPTVSIGASTGEPGHELFRVFGAVRLPDGRIVVLNQGSSELRYFDRAGTYVGAVGNDGDGPGEYRRLSQLLRHRDDSLLVWDSGRQRWSALSLDGRVLRMVSVRVPFANPFRLLGISSNAMTYAAYRAIEFPTGSQLIDQSLLLLQYDQDGALLDTVATFRNGSLRVVDEERRVVGGPLFEALHALAMHGDRIYSGHGDSPEIEVRDPSWRLRRVVRWTAPDRTIDEDDIGQYRAERVDALPDTALRRRVLRQFESTPVAEQYPAFQELKLDDAGTLWVKRYPRLASGVRWWLAFGADGIFVCQATLPGDFLPYEFGPGYVVGRHRDEIGVERVLQFDIGLPRRQLLGARHNPTGENGFVSKR